ncbi:MAG: hypothetical protein ACLT46_09410, partial [Hungatella sp.]
MKDQMVFACGAFALQSRKVLEKTNKFFTQFSSITCYNELENRKRRTFMNILFFLTPKSDVAFIYD